MNNPTQKELNRIQENEKFEDIRNMLDLLESDKDVCLDCMTERIEDKCLCDDFAEFNM